MTIFEHPQIPHTIVHGPKRFGRYRSGREREHDGADLPLVAPCTLPGFTMHEAWDPEGEKQSILVEKIERNQAVSLSQINGSRRRKTQRLNRDAERRRNGWFLWKPVRQAALPPRPGLARGMIRGRLGHCRRYCAPQPSQDRQLDRGKYRPRINPAESHSKRFHHRNYCRRCGNIPLEQSNQILSKDPHQESLIRKCGLKCKIETSVSAVHVNRAHL